MSFLRVRALRKSYRSAVSSIEVLKGVTFTLEKGEFLSIVGESGSGKSTLLQILGTLDFADAGEVFLGDISLHALPSAQQAEVRNRRLGFVYQAHHLIPELTALENVMLPLMIGGMRESQARDKAFALLERLHMAERARHIPARLSGGEAQRVAVARAMVGGPDLLLADEPTGNLDEETAVSVFSLMRELCRTEGASVIMVTHSQQLAARTDRTLRLQHGLLH